MAGWKRLPGINKLSISGSTDDVLNKCLPNLLECPVCFESMKPPIRLCRNGHNICSKCRPRLNNCPTCRQTILFTRNIALETLADHYLEPCGNSDVGCEVKMSSVEEIVKHMEECPFRLYDCECGRLEGCPWLGRRWQILNHVRDVHENTLILKEVNTCKIKQFNDFDHGTTTQIIVAYGELFWFYHEKDSSKSSFFGSVHYVGSEEMAPKYSYEFKFNPLKSSGLEVIFRRNTHKDTESLGEVFNTGDCFCLSTHVAKHFVGDDGNLRFSLTIYQMDGEHTLAD